MGQHRFVGVLRVRKDQGIRLTTDEVQLLDWFNSKESERSVVIRQDPEVGYMATVYSPLRAWPSHWANTLERKQGEAELTDFFQQGKSFSSDGDQCD